jgi:hypothetical protein
LRLNDAGIAWASFIGSTGTRSLTPQMVIETCRRRLWEYDDACK